MPILKSGVAEGGIEFENSFVTSSLCCPSRASFLTGLYTHNHDVWTNLAPDGGATKFDDLSTIASWLDDAGYNTGFIGKYMNDYDKIALHISPGWNDWRVFSDRATKYFDYNLNENGVINSYGVTKMII